MKHKEPLSAFIVPLIFGLTMVTALMLYIILPTEARKTVVIATEATTVEETLTEEETEPETAEIEAEDEQETSEAEAEKNDTAQQAPSNSDDANAWLPLSSEVETESESIQDDGDRVARMGADIFRVYGIWSGDYWHFTPEQIDAQWSGLKPSKPALHTGTTRAWQRYLYERLSFIGAEWFYPYAVAQAMQESGFNPLNQQGNDAVPDKGLFSFRVWYWNSAYGDIFDYRANIDAYIARISPYLTDRSEHGIYRAISQHYQPDGTIHMDYVQHVLGRLNELWEVE